MISYDFWKKILFKFDPETAHSIVERQLRYSNSLVLSPFESSNFVANDVLRQEVFGKMFENPIGLAAGFDKSATVIHATKAMGFGYTEIGTVTPKSQMGNEKPRLFRYPEHESLQNAMGFNNDGFEKVKERFQSSAPFDVPVGINIGKNKDTPQGMALDDYEILLKELGAFADYITINISSPNTPGLRDLQNKDFIKSVFALSKAFAKDKPVLLKIAPDLRRNQAIDLATYAVECGAEGIIATNTTVDYSLLDGCKDYGGLSGAVLKEKSFKIFEAVAKELYGKTTLISVGGIDGAEEAYKRIKAGATLLQLYSLLVFRGPKLLREINKGLTKLIEEDGFSNITQAIGADRK